MTKLKTLKDMMVDSWGEKYLRQEAINHIKELREHKFYCLICEKFDCDCGSSECFKPRSEEVEYWIRYFFNITEDDLKTNEKGEIKMGDRREVVCIGCGIIRIAEIDARETEKECHMTTKFVCPACSCPYVETKGQALEEGKK